MEGASAILHGSSEGKAASIISELRLFEKREEEALEAKRLEAERAVENARKKASLSLKKLKENYAKELHAALEAEKRKAKANFSKSCRDFNEKIRTLRKLFSERKKAAVDAVLEELLGE